MRALWIRINVVAGIVATLVAVAPAAAAQADVCGGFGPGIFGVYGPGNCYTPPNYDNPSPAPSVSTWPPGANFGSGGGGNGGNGDAPPIVPAGGP